MSSQSLIITHMTSTTSGNAIRPMCRNICNNTSVAHGTSSVETETETEIQG